MDAFRQIIGPDDGATTAQLSARAVVLFVFGIVCLRIAGRRTFAQYSPLDIIVALIVGSNIGRVMTGRAAFFPSLSATLVLVTLHRVLAMASIRWKGLARLMKAKPLRLVEDGRVDHDALRRANLSEDDLLEAVRLGRIDDLTGVKLATLEGGGEVSVVPKSAK